VAHFRILQKEFTRETLGPSQNDGYTVAIHADGSLEDRQAQVVYHDPPSQGCAYSESSFCWNRFK
jgi:hypothetical protein